MAPAAPVRPVRVEVGGQPPGVQKRYELQEVPVDTLSESPNFFAVATAFFGLRLLRPVLVVAAFAGGPQEEDAAASTAIAFSWLASIAGFLGEIVISSRFHEWAKQSGASPKMTWRLEPAALALFATAVFLDLLHQLLAVVSWQYFWSTGVEPATGSNDMLSFCLVILHALGLICLIALVLAYGRCFRASWRKFVRGPPPGYADDHAKRRPRVDPEEAEGLQPGQAGLPPTTLAPEASPEARASAARGPRQAAASPQKAQQPAAEPDEEPQFSASIPRPVGTPPHAWFMSDGEWVRVRIMRTMPNGGVVIRLPGGAVVNTMQSLLQPRASSKEPPPCPPPSQGYADKGPSKAAAARSAAGARDAQRRSSWSPTSGSAPSRGCEKEPGAGSAGASGGVSGNRPSSAPAGRDSSAGAAWASERLAMLRKELQGLDAKPASERRSILRGLQRELHPDKQPPEMRSYAQPLFMLVQKEWEINEAAAKSAAVAAGS